MKNSILYIVLLAAMTPTTLDIAPNPIRANGIISKDECTILMISELVEIDLYNDASHVKCTFHIENKGTDTELEIGFPAMEFQHSGFGGYHKNDKSQFSIAVDHHKLS